MRGLTADSRIEADDLVVDVGRRTITQAGRPIETGKLTFELLLALAESAPNVVTHDELAERVWSGRYVTPETVAQRVKILRRALGDDARKPRYIAVIRGQGYRLIPEVRVLADGATTEAGDSGDAGAAGPFGVSRRALAYAAGIAGAGAVPAIWALGHLLNGSAPPRYETYEAVRLARHADLEIFPAISPDGLWLAYSRGPLGRMDIWIRRTDDVDAMPINLTAGIPGDHRWPRWSQDSNRIAYRSTNESTGHSINVYDLESSSTPLVIVEATYLAGHDWSSAGDELVYADITGNALRIYSFDSRQSRTLAELKNPNAPVWSPDGRSVLCVSENHGYAFGSGGNLGNVATCSIWHVAVDTGRMSPLIDADCINTSPAWSGDGASFFYVSDREGRRRVFHAPIPADGSLVAEHHIERLADGLNAHTIDVARDGGTLLFSELALRQNIWRYPIVHDRVASPSMDELEPVTTGEQYIEAVCMSPDARLLFFDSDADSGTLDLKVMPLDGSGQAQNIWNDDAHNCQPQLSPSGREVAFYSFRAGFRQIMVGTLLNRAGKMHLEDVRQVTFTPSANSRYPQWAADGQTLVYYSDAKGGWELFLIKRDPQTGRWSEPEQLTFEGHGRDLQISPKGDGSLIYIGRIGDVNTALIRMDAERRRTLLLELEHGYAYFAWARDGETIYMKMDEFGAAGGGCSIWEIPAGGGEPVRLVDLRKASPSGFDRREFDVDDDHFYFTIAERRSDIWRVRLRPTGA